MSQEGKYKNNLMSANLQTTAREKALNRIAKSNRRRGLNHSINSFVAVFGLTIGAYYTYVFSINYFIAYLILVSLGYLKWRIEKNIKRKEEEKIHIDLNKDDNIVIGGVIIGKREQKNRCPECDIEYKKEASFCPGCGSSFDQ